MLLMSRGLVIFIMWGLRLMKRDREIGNGERQRSSCYTVVNYGECVLTQRRSQVRGYPCCLKVMAPATMVPGPLLDELQVR